MNLDALLDHPAFAGAPPRDLDAYARRAYAQLAVVNEAVGGAGPLLDDPRTMSAVLDWAAVVDPSLFAAAAIHYAVVLTSIKELGRPEESLESAIASLDRLDAVGAILITEIGHGNNHISLQTQAVYEPETRTFRLHTPTPGARKLMASIALPGVAKIGTVYADLVVDGRSCGTFAFVVPLRDAAGLRPGVLVEPLEGSVPVALDYSVTSFDGVRVPYDHWLRDTASITSDGRFEDPLGNKDRRLVRSLALSAWASLAGAVGLASASRAAAAIALRYAATRSTMGRLSPDRPVLDYRTQQHALYGALASAHAVTALVDKAIEAFLAKPWEVPPDETAITFSPWVAAHRTHALAKAAATELCAEITAECRRRTGAQGVLSINRIIAYEGLAQGYNSAGGDNLLILLDAGRSMAETLQPCAVPDTVTGDLADPDVRLGLLRVQEATLHAELAASVRQAGDAGLSPFDAWNPHLPKAAELARVHQRRMVAEAFRALVAERQDEALAAAERLYGLRDLHRGRAWLLERGVLSPAEALSVADLADKAVDDVAAHAQALLDGLGLPERRLGAWFLSA
ncbi:acyl-CoA dehydrogenase [Nonomuraea zeae]|uniref:Uncharacterized protein n=1 Tax=Nonomuraea zeae TaxID=1642303 RepID=A0A5S4G7R4_9ACTN|nr:acyl-CoA dehydrogenase [Nonomuraea zeae]TMR29058.1 hypothetical protein ETD85_33635 [Nonomuraea zeae]